MIKYFTLMATMAGISFLAHTATAQEGVPTLLVTNKPLSEVLKAQNAPLAQQPSTVSSVKTSAPTLTPSANSLYSKPVQLDDIDSDHVLNADYFSPVETKASQKIKDIENEMYGLQGQVADASEQLRKLEIVGQDLAANYYAAVATINTQLQSGTTPGNPRLKNRLTLAEDSLETLAGNVADLNVLAVKISDLASVGNFLHQQARSAYSLSGSVEEDHVALAQLEDELSNTSVAVERLLNTVNDDITRAAAYMASERANLRTLSLAITNGDLYGKSLASRPFSMAGSTDIVERSQYQSMASASHQEPLMPVQSVAAATPSQPRPLMKIRFDRPNVDYSQALYMSVSEAMDKYPNSQFELIAVSPGMGNPAKLAIESTKARRNAEKVLRNMVQMGVDTHRVHLANLTQDDIQFNEVHLYIQ